MTTTPERGLRVLTGGRHDWVTVESTRPTELGLRTMVRYDDGTLVEYWTETLRIAS